MSIRRVLCAIGFCLVLIITICAFPRGGASGRDAVGAVDAADLILTGGRVYSLNWPDPSAEGVPHEGAPFDNGRWRPDGEAVAIRGGEIIFVGANNEAMRFSVSGVTRVIDLAGACVLPGFVDSHTHVANMGQLMARLNLKGIKTPAEVIERAVEWAKNIPEGEWVIGHGWDEGDWATHGYPDWSELNQRLPNHPVVLDGLHGFATWANKMAFELAGIDTGTPDPVGGEIRRNEQGELTGILVNNATDLLAAATPDPTHEQRKAFIRTGLREMATSGYVAIQEAGVYSGAMEAWEELAAQDDLLIRVYGMISATDDAVVERSMQRGPWASDDNMLFIRSVKAYYDGSLGARGARLLADYADQPDHRGVSGDNYGFDQERVAALMERGFQVAIHAIGDAGNRETIDFIESVIDEHPSARALRHRIEHAQVLHPDDFPRTKELNLVASMQPPHAVEDMMWARFRLGRERLAGAYAWRTFRRHGVVLAFGSDLNGSDHDIFYGLHAAITRRNKEQLPKGGWFPEQAVTVEEAVRGYTCWPAYAAHLENNTGVLAPGRWADISVIDIDPFDLARTDPGMILDGEVLMTIVNGRVVFEAGAK